MQLVDNCYCKHVTKNENEKLYKEINDLLGIYIYTKDKINIKPYIIISKEL